MSAASVNTVEVGRIALVLGGLIAASLLPVRADGQPPPEPSRQAAREGEIPGVNHASGGAGSVVVVTAQVSPERFERGFVAGLQADARGDHEAAKLEYERVQRLGRCGPRCEWHLSRTDRVLAARSEARLQPEEAGANVSYAIELHNKLVSLRLDAGHMPAKLVDLALRHYRIALDLAADSPSTHGDVLLGFAAFQGELGRGDVAMRLLKGVDVDGLETATQIGNLAYFYTTVGRLDLALPALERALSLDGPRGLYRQWAAESDDYHRIRHLPRFKELLELY